MSTPSLPSLEDLGAAGSCQEALHERAASVARERFGRRAFVRAVVEVSNHCRENCAYCGMRRDNASLSRYRAQHDQLAELLIHHQPATVTDVNLQAGEDPVAVREVVLPLVRTLRRETGLGVSVCLGTLTPRLYDQLRGAGASIYILKFELADRRLYSQLEAPGTLEERTHHIRLLARSGWRVSSGFIAGLPGQDMADLRACFQLANELPLRGCSVSPFIAGEDTPFAAAPPASTDWALNCMAALRLMRPGWVIPCVSALNLTDRDGYRRGLRAGANLVTINLTPDSMRGDYLIYKRDRFVMTEERILAALEAERLCPSTQGLAEFFESGGPAAAPGNTEQATLPPMHRACPPAWPARSS